MASGGEHTRAWWQRRDIGVALVLAFALPLLFPAIPPLADYPGHLARYRIAQGGSALLAQWFDYRWQLLPNLGVDAIVAALAPVIGVERAGKVVVIAIPMVTTAAMLTLSRQVHGRLPAATLFALPLGLGWPFHLGFVNYCLAMGLALAALAAWIALASRPAVRAVVGAAIAFALWLTHAFGWGAFGLWAFAADVALRRRAGVRAGAAVGGAVVACLPLAWPMLLMLGTASAPLAPDLWNAGLKAIGVASVLRDHWRTLDIASAVVVLVVVYAALRRGGAFDPVLGWPALLGWAAYLVLPDKIMGGSFVDMRMAPYVLAMTVLAIRPGPAERALATAGVAFIAVRLVATTASLGLHATTIANELGALDHIAPGARVFSLAAVPCYADNWNGDRFNHLASLAIVRRDAFANDQWAIAGQQLLSVDAAGAGRYDRDPSELIYTQCGETGRVALFEAHLAHFPRAAFDMVWTIGFPAVARPGLTPVWTSPRSALYRIER